MTRLEKCKGSLVLTIVSGPEENFTKSKIENLTAWVLTCSNKNIDFTVKDPNTQFNDERR